MPYNIKGPCGGDLLCYYHGENESGFGGQRFDVLKQQCLKQKKLFEDPEFKADAKALGNSLRFVSKSKHVVWKRPGEICRKPWFFAPGKSRSSRRRFQAKQGRFGDCWVIAAVSCLTQRPEYFEFVVPPNQTFNKKEYAGIFRVRFWINGRWVEVVVDDLLPTINGKLIFQTSEDEDEFWSAIVEKAYAKLNGSYSILIEGHPSEALLSFTGGVVKIYEINDLQPMQLFRTLLSASKNRALMSVSINASLRTVKEVEQCGLVSGHAYSVTGIEQVKSKGKYILLLKMRNPWGSGEWQGDWCDRSNKWNTLDAVTKKRLRPDVQDDGEFYMEFNDFLRYFTELEVCEIHFPSRCSSGSEHKDDTDWQVDFCHSEWTMPDRAGGKQSPEKNPKLSFKVTDKSEVTVAVLHKNIRHYDIDALDLSMGFAVYQVKENKKFANLDHTLLRRPCFQASSIPPAYPENALTFEAAAGNYVIVAYTEDPKQEAENLIRVYTKDAISDETELLKAFDGNLLEGMQRSELEPLLLNPKEDEGKKKKTDNGQAGRELLLLAAWLRNQSTDNKEL